MIMSNVVTRFAPSPTGYLHAGNYRTAVFAYLFAKHEGGKLVVRIEDTDAARSKKEYEDNIFDALKWLELTADETYRQSEHRARHRTLLEKLIADGTAYISKETPEKEGDRDEVIRFKNPGGALTFIDVIRGDIATDVTDLGDFIIARSLDEPVFHFAVVVDDADEGITHVIRGGDHISNTARQMLLQRALGFATPLYAHLPLIMDNTHKKLGKRNGAKALTDYREMGILPEAILNYLAFLGWNPGDEREYMSRDELIKDFDLTRVQKGSAVFDEVKLLSVNQHWMRELSDDAYLSHLNADITRSNLVKIVPLLKERAKTFGEAREMLEGELGCFFTEPEIAFEKLTAKEPADRAGMTKDALESLVEPINALGEGVTPEVVKDTLMPLADAFGWVGAKPGTAGSPDAPKLGAFRGAVLWPLRYALSGQERSPDPFTLVSILGSAEAVSRIKKAIAML